MAGSLPVGKILHAKDGKLGFMSNRGFVAATNFLVDIQAQVFSEKGQMLP